MALVFGWIAVIVHERSGSSHFHILPSNDLKDHEADPMCWCVPEEDEEDPNIWVHNAMDRREEYERGRMRH